jgi:hypothetical protein
MVITNMMINQKKKLTKFFLHWHPAAPQLVEQLWIW